MQIIRTLVWLVILLGVLAFSFANWDERATVHIWSNLVWETRLPAVVIVSFLLGMLPVWMLHRGCLLYTSPSPRDRQKSRMPSSA